MDREREEVVNGEGVCKRIKRDIVGTRPSVVDPLIEKTEEMLEDWYPIPLNLRLSVWPEATPGAIQVLMKCARRYRCLALVRE